MIEAHVTSREISERLKKLGFERESVFCHRKGVAPRMDRPSGYTEVTWCGPKPQSDDIPAYLASELGEVLKLVESGTVWLNMIKGYLICKDDTLQDRFGRRIIWLIENGHMS